MEFLRKLFDTSDFPPRWHCGVWTDAHGWLHILSDLGIWSAYFAIPLVLIYFTYRRTDLPFRRLFLLFGAFILLCGLTHLMEAIIFWWPLYRVAGLIKLATAVVSWATVVALVPIIPRALAMRSPEELEREIVARRRVEEQLHEANAELERRVEERTNDLRSTNQELHSEREWFSTTLASMGEGVIASDAQGRVRFLNDVATSLTGWSAEKAKGQLVPDVLSIIDDESRQKLECPVQRVLRLLTEVAKNQATLVAQDGTERSIEMSAAPIRSTDGSVLGVVVVFRDNSDERMHDRRRAARLAMTQTIAQARRLDESIGLILEQASVYLGWEVATYLALDEKKGQLTCQGYWESASLPSPDFKQATLERTFDRDVHSLPGRAWVERTPQHMDMAKEDLFPQRSKAARAVGLRRGLAIPIETDSGFHGVLEFATRLDRPTDPDMVELLSTMGVQLGQFIERQRAEQQLREEEERSRSVMNHVVDGIVTINERGEVETFNPAAERLFGWTKDEILGQNVRVIVPPPDESQHDDYIKRYLETGVRHIIGIGREVLGKHRDGSTFPLELSVSEFSLKGQRHFTGILRDITERKRAEDELRAIAAKLSESNRRKSEFLAMLAHELRNPLAPIRNGLELMKMTRNDPATVEFARDVLERQTKQLITLVDDLLDVSRLTLGKLEIRPCRIQLGDVVQSAVEAVTPMVRDSQHTLQVDLPEEPITMVADPNRLTQVLSNLLNNACKYTPEGGTISLSARKEEHCAVISVRDNGLGIPSEARDHIFEMFTQIDRPMEKVSTGLGIGLTLVQSLVAMHRGSIDVQSEGEGKGSEFIVRLPIEAGSSTCDSEVAFSPPLSRKLRVLVVDDNRAALEMLAPLVKLLGNEVQTAQDGMEAVRVAETLRPDVIIMDIGMPRMNGYEAARCIRREPWGKSVLLVALTGWGQQDDRLRTREAGFDEHLVKPADPAELERLFARFSRERSFSDR